MKHFGIAILVVFATCLAISYAQSHNVTFGRVGPRDLLLFKTYVIKKSKPMFITSENVQYPPKGIAQLRNITAVRVIDNFRNGTGGYASLLNGGPGYRNVTIHFKSQRGKGYNFRLEIFGQY